MVKKGEEREQRERNTVDSDWWGRTNSCYFSGDIDKKTKQTVISSWAHNARNSLKWAVSIHNYPIRCEPAAVQPIPDYSLSNNHPVGWDREKIKNTYIQVHGVLVHTTWYILHVGQTINKPISLQLQYNLTSTFNNRIKRKTSMSPLCIGEKI